MANAIAQTPTASPYTLAVRWRILITAALLFHLTAVIAAPMRVPNFTSEGIVPAGPIEIKIGEIVQPYLSMAYLDHGYRFFAPFPSAGHLVRYQFETPDGKTESGIFPNLKTEWPRLYYHRYFMLSEKLNRYWDPDEPSPKDEPREHGIWQDNRATFLDVAHGYAMQLLKESGSRQVTLELVRHELPNPSDLLRNRPLTDPASYKTLWSKTYEAETQ